MADGVSRTASLPNFKPDHLEEFSASLTGEANPDDTGGKHGRTFGEGLPGVAIELLPARQIKRSTVFELAYETKVNTQTVCAAAMAWGGMQMHHRDMAFLSPHAKEWLAVAEKLRAGQLSRSEGYDAFRQLMADGKLKGMGPAYFTKLIYFLMPRSGLGHPPGFIMDQWAGCSVNLLIGDELVRMDSTGTWKQKGDAVEKGYGFNVSKVNTGQTYENFCTAIELLAAHFSFSGDEIDRALLSDGGTKPASWRRYVKLQYPKEHLYP